MKKSYFIIIFLLIISFKINAQEEWSGKFSLGGSYYKGNVEKTDIRSDGSVSHKDSTFEFSTDYKTVYGRTGKIENNREFSSSIKFDWKPYSIVSPYLAFENYSNIYKGYDLRLSGLAGAKWAIYKTENSDISLSSAVLYSIENYTQPKDTSEFVKPNNEIIRLSVRPKISQKLGENVTFKLTTYYQPNVNLFSDYIVETSASLSNKLTNILSMDLTFEYDYVSSPPSEDIKKEDIAFIVSLLIKLN